MACSCIFPGREPPEIFSFYYGIVKFEFPCFVYNLIVSNWVGRRLGKVQIESLVARGGVAEVYVGTHTTLERKVAVKILRNLNEDDSDALYRFQQEARVIAKFRHPNIVQVHDFDTVDHDPYLVMEYIDGPSLSQYLKALHQNHARLPLPQVIRLIHAVASALQYAHKNGVIHRDIKPGNILLTSPSSPVVIGKPLPDDFEPILTDFGLVRFLDANRETTTGHIAGTPAYMSPEQARGETTDTRTDVYSLGIVLYEMLAGHTPFDGETTMSILLRQVSEPPPPIPGLSPFIEHVLNRALAKDRNERFQTPLELANTFEAAVKETSEHSTMQTLVLPESLPALPHGQVARSHWVRISVLTAITLALGGFLLVKAFPSAPGGAATATSTISTLSPSNTVILPTGTATSTQSPVPPVSSGGLIHFQNANAIADQVSLTVHGLPPPPAGNQYEIWLINGNDRLSLGVFSPNGIGESELTFSDPQNQDLIARYNTLEITIEPKPDSDPRTSGLVAYSFTYPPEGLIHIRYLLTSFPNTPGRTALAQGLFSDIETIDKLATEMKASYSGGDRSAALANAETMLNILVGVKSPDYKDWNRDGKIDPIGTYGLLVNGSNFGYIQAVSAEAGYAVLTPDATQFMIDNGAVVKACTQNLAEWAPQLREVLLSILTADPAADISAAINDATALADQMVNGIDHDQNGKVDTIAGECGAKLAYQYTYSMADMPILPVSISYQLTQVANPSSVAPTKTRDSSNSQPVSTAQPKPTKKSNPTQKPPPAERTPKKP